ncbi:MAG: rhodanese-like domain-containing protein [Chloroflexi bacterium]|nr:MAG: rhodanese-like domain-containing protein [Chloroflexota bacterium]
MKFNKPSLRTIRIIALTAVIGLLAVALAACAAPAGSEGADSSHAAQQVTVQEISIDKAYQLYQDKVAFLDVRTPEEWNAAHVPGSTLLPLEDLEDRAGELPRDLELVVYCRTGNRSAQAAKILMEAGFTEVYSMDGGLSDWIEAGYEVDPGD